MHAVSTSQREGHGTHAGMCAAAVRKHKKKTQFSERRQRFCVFVLFCIWVIVSIPSCEDTCVIKPPMEGMAGALTRTKLLS